MAVWLKAILTLRPGVGCQQLAEWLDLRGNSDIVKAGGRLWGLWDGRCGLGFGSDEAILMSMWPDDASAGAAVELLKAMPQVIDVAGTPLHPTLRPTHEQPASGSGSWIFRDVHLAEADLREFLTRSDAARKELESAFDSEVTGVFRGPNVNPGTAALLLVTRHASLGSWELWRSEPTAPQILMQLDERDTRARWTRARSACRIPLPHMP